MTERSMRFAPMGHELDGRAARDPWTDLRSKAKRLPPLIAPRIYATAARSASGARTLRPRNDIVTTSTFWETKIIVAATNKTTTVK
jgi:hypothetical protein